MNRLAASIPSVAPSLALPLLLALLTLLPAGPAASQEPSAAASQAQYTAQLAPQFAAQGRAEAGALEGTLDPAEYILGPGDVLAVGFWGDVVRNEEAVVNPDGDVLISPVGPLRVTGMTLEAARSLIKEQLAPYYKPEVLSVSLLAVRSFQVHVVGTVQRPGNYEVNAVTRVSQAISRAGGSAVGASDRNILLLRGEDTLRVDLARYLLLGDNGGNPFLGDGDVVYVPPHIEPVEVFGSVYREGSYEYRPGETLGAMLELAGGLRPEAKTDSIEIRRFRTDDPTQTETIFLRPDEGDPMRFELARGDRIFVRGIPDWHRDAKVTIRGEVEHPGVYVVSEGAETLTQVVTRAGGLTDRASLAEARLIRGAYASRKFPAEEIDTLASRENALTEKEQGVTKTFRREPKGAASVDFETVFAAGERGPDPVLYDGDIIDIPRAALFVRVSGQVKNPGLVAFKPGEGSKYYIGLAGGFAPGADKSGTRLVTALNGQIVRTRGMAIRPGDTIWVPLAPERSWWSSLKDVVAVLASLATIYFVIDTISGG